jgi:hypothetical protein
MQIFIRIVLAIFTPTSDADAEGLHRFAPGEVTVDRAYGHVWAERVAAAVYGIDTDKKFAASAMQGRVMIAALLALLLTTDAAVEQLHRTAPAYLTIEQARVHYAAARAAEWKTGERAELLLAVAWHESRYDAAAITPEPGGRVSCGVLTPYPTSHCEQRSLVEQYIDGAHHLAGWRRICHGDEWCTLTALAGGGGLVALCRAGEEHRGCRFAAEMLRRARWIDVRPNG